MSDDELLVDRQEHLDRDWLGAVLARLGHDVEVVEVVTERIGTGQMGTSVRLTPTYRGPDAASVPATLVAKLPSPDEGRRASVAGIHRTEVGFYRHLAPTLAVRTPALHFSAISPDATRFVLLLEDLAPREQGDQIAGCTPGQAAAAVRNLAGLHGPRWCDPALRELDWLGVVDEDGAEMVGLIAADATGRFLERYGPRMSGEDRDLLAGLPEVLPRWILAHPERFAPLHGDYRLDNLLFGPGDDPVATVDWQTVTLGLPGRDVAYFLATGLRPADRRAHEDDLVAEYHRALLAHGVRDHALDQCRRDVAFGMLQGPLITVVGAAYSETTERGDEMFLAMATRSCSAIRDHATLDLL